MTESMLLPLNVKKAGDSGKFEKMSAGSFLPATSLPTHCSTGSSLPVAPPPPPQLLIKQIITISKLVFEVVCCSSHKTYGGVPQA